MTDGLEMINAIKRSFETSALGAKVAKLALSKASNLQDALDALMFAENEVKKYIKEQREKVNQE